MGGRNVNQRARPAPDDLRVLFVEDDASVAQMYRLKLELDGYTVDVVGDGLVGLEKARASHPDIILLDITSKTRRPGRNEGTAGRGVNRGDPGRDPVQLERKGLVEQGAHLGALDHLIKSQTTPTRLSQRLKDWLAG